jgi:DNA-binding LytR/AlgR family response regulator
MKIGIVEDELLIAEKIKMILTELGYAICEPVSSYGDALEMISIEKPDFILLDINLGRGKTGIDIALYINEHHRLPFIFLTANSDMATIESAKKTHPFAYLVKPFTKDDLYVAIEIAVNNFNQAPHTVGEKTDPAKSRNYLFSWDGQRFVKILFNEIAYIESKENYIYVHTISTQKITLRSTLQDFSAQLPAENFLRVHRRYVIQTDLIKNLDYAEVSIAGIAIPLGKTYRDDLFAHLGIKN